MAAVQPQTTKVIDTIKVDKNLTSKKLADKIGRPLGSPINGHEEGQAFKATLTGIIEIREFAGQKGAYFTTKEGYSIRVNASFDPNVHKEGQVMDCVCRVFEQADGRKIKFTAFAA